ncbi:putative porin [Lewinella sp. LCG006]|uniref:putative porin n=1 Tax=Lewinella sp. LCG006 TaxID=3231911 RepID=UPI0034604F69
MSVSFTDLLPLRLFVLFCMLSLGVQAQRPTSTFPNQSGGGNTPNNRRGGDQRESAPDTFGIFIFQVDNPNEERPYDDSLLTTFHQFDPTRQRSDDYANLGILGSAHQPLVYQGEDRGGFSLGWNQYDLYYVTGRSMPYYRLERPYTDLQFVQGSEQQDNVISAKFSRNFANGINYALDYRAITQEASGSQYPNQRNQTRALATGFWLHSKGGRYDGFLSYAANTTNAEENGGILTLPETDGEFDSPATAQVFLTDAQSRSALREVMYTQYYRFGGQVDSTGRSRRAFTLSHQFDYDKNTYRFADAFNTSDTTFYQRFPSLLLDVRGARYYVEQRSVENSFRLSTYRLATGNRLRQQKDLIEVGLTHRYNNVQMEPGDTVVNNLLLTGKIGLRPGDRLRLQLEGLLALWDQAGDFRIKGNLDVDLKKAGLLRLEVRNQLYAPTLLESRFLLTQQELYRRNFNKTVATKLAATYRLESIGIELGGAYHLLNNFIYFDSTAAPQQTGTPISILQLSAQKDFRFGAFSLRNRIVLQQTDEEFLRLPGIFAKHSLVYNGLWFKVLNVQLGADVRYTTAFQPDYYNPFIAQFQLQNRQEVDFFPNVDAYFSFRVSTFRFFIKGENLSTIWAPDQRLFLSAFYPWPSSALRFGVSWRMLD